MSLTEWQDFVFAAGHLDDADPIAHWRKQSADQQVVADRLARLEQLRIVAPDTDLTVNVAGRPWLNADGRENFPDGEVYTSPHPRRHRRHHRLLVSQHLRRQAGRGRAAVVRARAGGQGPRRPGQEHLESILDTDEGARFLGEVAFGLNDEIQMTTGETLFDEKIGGTCHVALGMAFPEAGGTNPSGIHWDMVCDLRRQSQVFGDGELIFENGRFL